MDEPGAAKKLKETPVPVSETVCGLPVALSVMLSAPVLVPVAVGRNVTRMAQLAPAARLEPQVLVWEKSPLVLMLLMLSVVLPVF